MLLKELYNKNPLDALDYALSKAENENDPWNRKRIFIWCSLLGLDRKTRYGSYKYIGRDDLKDRKFNVEFWDGNISIFWTDILHNPKTFNAVKEDFIL